MPRQARRDVTGSFFHVINRSVRKVRIFVNRADYRAFLTVLEEGLALHPVKLVSYCVMPNHWHLVVGPTGTGELSAFMQWVTATHAIRWHRHHKTVGQGPVYQGRFHSNAVEGAAELVHVCRYVERNALRAHLVQRAQDWPWCSLSDRLRADATVPLQPAVFLATDMWIEYVNAAVTPRELVEAQAKSESTSGTELPETVENSSVPLLGDAQDPGSLTAIFEDTEDFIRDLRAGDDDQADPHVERPEHLCVVNSAPALEPAEEWGDDPALAID